jgi:hypothetical protein
MIWWQEKERIALLSNIPTLDESGRFRPWNTH